jgi:hypothetical protein
MFVYRFTAPRCGNNYIVPQWTCDKVRAARWDRFSHPDKLPEYCASAFPIVVVVGSSQGGENRGPQMRRDGDGLKLDAAEVAAGGLLARFPDEPDG